MSRKHRSTCRRSPREELYAFLRQTNISGLNIERVRKLAQDPDDGVKALAGVVLEIARVKPHKRRRMQIIAQEYPDLFMDMVAILGNDFWNEFFFRYGDQPEWLYERCENARSQIRFRTQGNSPCWCGSGRAYWLCCADRDDVFAEQPAAEERERERVLNPDSIPWWDSDSDVDHYTRSGYMLFYIDRDHPLAIAPPELREEFAACKPVKKTRVRQKDNH